VSNWISVVTMQLTKRMAPQIYIAGQRALISYIGRLAICYTCNATDHLSQHCPPRRHKFMIRSSPKRPNWAQLVEFGDSEHGATQSPPSQPQMQQTTLLSHLWPIWSGTCIRTFGHPHSHYNPHIQLMLSMSRTKLQGPCRRHVNTHNHPHSAETGKHCPKTQKAEDPHDITSVRSGAGQSPSVRMVINHSSRLTYSLRIKSQNIVKKRSSFRSWRKSAGSLNALGANYLEERKQR
jgi:hypothetical protein